MQTRKTLPRTVGATALALLLGAGAVHAGDADKTSGDSQAPAAAAGAETSGAGTSGGSAQGGAQLSKGDRNIMRDMAQANLAEIQTSELALERTQDPQIRQFAQRMIDDHTRMQDELKQVAEAKGVDLPTEPAAKHKQVAERLAGMQGAEFDRMYREEVAEKAHEETHKKLEQAQQRVEDPQLSALVQKSLPVVGQHLSTAESMDAGAGRSSGEGAAGDAAASSAEPAGASGASMSIGSSGGADVSAGESAAPQSGAESVTGTSGSSNMRGPGKE